MTQVTGVLLAAGAARRFGSHKLMHPLADGTPVAVAAARNLVAAVPDALAVVRPGDDALIAALQETGIAIAVNPAADCLMADSIETGIDAAAAADAWLIALGDMPCIRPATLRQLVKRLSVGESIVAPQFDGRRGNPVGFAARWRETLRALQGDQGARRLLSEHAAELTLCTVDDPGVIYDIDLPDDLQRHPT